jgi:hypothetical protein
MGMSDELVNILVGDHGPFKVIITVQRVHKVREHFKLFIAQELQIIQTSYACHFEEKL